MFDLIITDIIDRLLDEYNRLFDELLFADKCIKVLTEFKIYLNSNQIKHNLVSNQLKVFNDLFQKIEEIFREKNNCLNEVTEEVDQVVDQEVDEEVDQELDQAVSDGSVAIHGSQEPLPSLVPNPMTHRLKHTNNNDIELKRKITEKNDEEVRTRGNKVTPIAALKATDGQLVCPIEYCGKRFPKENNLKCHLQRHQRTYDLKCDRTGCDFKTRDEVLLTKHKKEHNDSTPTSDSQTEDNLSLSADNNKADEEQGSDSLGCPQCPDCHNNKGHIRQQYQQNQEMQHKMKGQYQINGYWLTPSMLVSGQNSDTESMICKNLELKSTDKSISSIEGSVRADGCDDEKTTFFIGDDNSSQVSQTEYVDCGVQTDDSPVESSKSSDTYDESESSNIRDLKTLLELYESTDDRRNELTTLEVKHLVDKQYIKTYKLESSLGNAEKGVAVRRLVIEDQSARSGVLSAVPFTQFDYSLVLGACCENVIGYVPVPLGVAGPLKVNGKSYYVPMATTEGCLVASTNRGCRALTESGGVKTSVYADGMTRGPVIHFPTAMRAVEAMQWLQKENNFIKMKEAFDSTSRFARLQRIHPRIAGRYLYLRFVATTGDAMGMNMLSKATESALLVLNQVFSDIEASCLSGNFCADKKSAAVNWIEGRGKSVVSEAVIPAKVIRDTLKTTARALQQFNISKNLIGSAVAGSMGGNNAHAANMVAAMFIACGQDPAQTVSSSNCITLMEAHGTDGQDLLVSCTMPSIEIGTVGGGTVLSAQSACLDLLGVKGSSQDKSATNSTEFASIVCATVLAGELSLMSALATGHLVRSHIKHNRSNRSDTSYINGCSTS